MSKLDTKQLRAVSFTATCLNPELAKDREGRQICIGQTVRFTEASGNAGGGPVVAIAGDVIIFMIGAEPAAYAPAKAGDVEIIPDYYSLIQLTSAQQSGRRS